MKITDDYTIECLKSYLPVEFQPRLVVPFDVDPEELIVIAVQSSSTIAEGIANCLKFGVEHTSDSHVELALQLADTIIAIGERREEGSLVGLGMMARGDTLAHAGHLTEAWETLDSAGTIFHECNDEVGWARTRIVRLAIGAELGSTYVDRVFADAVAAEAIFEKAGRYDRLLRLHHGWALAYVVMGQYEEAIAHYQQAAKVVQQQNDPHSSKIMLAHLYTDTGYAYNNLGLLKPALEHLDYARQVLLEAKIPSSAAMAEYAIANNHIVRGEYRQALHLLLNTVIPNLTGHFAYRGDFARLSVIDCYLALNRNEEAYELASEVLKRCQEHADHHHQIGLTALFLGTAQARLKRWDETLDSFGLAEAEFKAYMHMAALIQLRRGQIALHQGDFQNAREIAHNTVKQFKVGQQLTNWIDAVLLEAEAAMLSGDLSAAQELAQEAMVRARQENWLPVRYRSYLVLGQILEQSGQLNRSIRFYQAALEVLRRMERSLTVSLRTGFLEDKLLPFHRLMHIYLSGNQMEAAFDTLEQLKSQVFRNYLTQRERLRWPETDQTHDLLEKLRTLRDRHRWLNRLQVNPPVGEAEARAWYREIGVYTDVQQSIIDCEKQMRHITDQLYLFSEVEAASSDNVVRLSDVQQYITDDALLIEFYADQDRVWCFAVSRDSAAVYACAGSTTEIRQLIEDKWWSNLDFALKTGADDTRIKGLTVKAQRIGEKLFQMLLQPVAELLKQKKQVIIIPFGFLHQVPFNILRDGGTYLIRTHEVVTLPSAALLSRSTPDRENGAMVLAHNWEGRLTHTIPEGEMVHRFMGGEFFVGEDSVRSRLQQRPRKVLHISTHGEHRIDQPDFAYIELSDGPVYTDDLLQCDLSYELVVLSACETGRAKVVAGDELIGLGRGFLYAGAGTLIASLWRVNETHTYALMETFYRELCGGRSKVGALQAAQCELLAHNENLHPAFWGAFQLIGDGKPLNIA